MKKSMQHENYKELIWALAKTDFTLRYHGSVLGYVWALLKPLFIFGILYFVFSSIFNPKGVGNEFYSIELLVSIMLFNFFSEGTTAGMASLLSKSQLITKIYVPRWALIIASTLNSTMVFGMNLIVVILLAVYKQFIPSVGGVLLFALFAVLTYALIVAFALLTAPLYVRFRDLLMIWEVMLTALFYAAPIIYPLSMMPKDVQQALLINPLGFIIHSTKESLVHGRYPDLWQTITFTLVSAAAVGIGILAYRKFSQSIAEDI